MGTVKPQYLAFNAGELDANGLARADLENYPRGAETLENIIPYVQGRMEKAPGTQYIGDVTNESRIQDAAGNDLLDANSDEIVTPGNTDVVLRPFVFDESTKFVLEMVEGRIRIISGTGYVQTGGAAATLGAWSDESAAPSTGGAAAPSVDLDEFDVNIDTSGLYARLGPL